MKQMSHATAYQERGQTIAVTGAASFLGSRLIGLLEKSPRVRRIISLDRDPPPTKGGKTRHFFMDLTNQTVEDSVSELLASEDVDTVVHLAFHDNPSHRPDDSHYLESIGTMRMLNACRRTQIAKFILWSQTSLYGASPKNPCFLNESKPLCASISEAYFRDKIQAERDALEFGQPGRGRLVTVLRTAPIIGPEIDNYITRYFSQSWIPTVLGFDPLWQFLHESDAVAAFLRAIEVDVPGVFNIAGAGAIPLSRAIRLTEGRCLPLTRPLAALGLGLSWAARRGALPSSFTDYIQYSCIGDPARSLRSLGFKATYDCHAALLDFKNPNLSRRTPTTKGAD